MNAPNSPIPDDSSGAETPSTSAPALAGAVDGLADEDGDARVDRGRRPDGDGVEPQPPTRAPGDDDTSATPDSIGEPPVSQGPMLGTLGPAPEVEIPDLGTVRLRDLAGPPGAPVIVLLHGWTATSDLNFFTCYEALAEHYRVIAFDHRGHGYGLRSRKTFRLEDAADDVISVLDYLEVERAIVLGYSMGGAIAQLLWFRHRDRVDGLVLAATAPYFSEERDERLGFMGLSGLAKLARITPATAQKWLTEQFYLQRKEATWGEAAMEQIERHDWRAILEAGQAIGDFDSAAWIDEIDAPTAVIVTMRDPVVPTRRQVELWAGIHQAEVFRVDGAHDAIVNRSERFVPQILRALESVTARAASRARRVGSKATRGELETTSRGGGDDG